MKRALLISILIITLALPLAACGQHASADVVKSDQPRETSPNVSPVNVERLVEGNSGFAFDLYQALREKDEGNIFYSPYSISQALAMTWAGARGQTEEQMAATLHFEIPQEVLHPAFNSLDSELEQRGCGAQGRDGEGFRLHIVNAIWGQKDYTFLEDFLDVLAKNYGAGLRVLDFIREPEQSRITINRWVSDQTEGRIEDLIPQGMIRPVTRLVLTNAIYFNAAWLHAFDENMTSDGAFHLIDGTEVSVPMMRQTESFRYMAGEEYQAIELPYDGGELSMLVLLPEQQNFHAFEQNLRAGQVADIIAGLTNARVTLTMPKFEYESDFNLTDTLAGMGMPLAFSDGADFSGMTGTKELYISQVLHKAFVAVDEAGTEAAAATAVIMDKSAAPAQPVEVVVDSPFVFLIRDIDTGTILFIGRVMNPTG